MIVLDGLRGLVKTYDQVFNQLSEMPGAFLVAKMKVVEITTLFCSCSANLRLEKSSSVSVSRTRSLSWVVICPPAEYLY
jgi:hypothetical protein